MSASEVGELLEGFRAGRLRFSELTTFFRQRTWTISRRPVPSTYAEMAEQQDPAEDVPGSFDEVTAAYDRGELTPEQYDALAEAVADSIRGHAQIEP
jgi:hypothetical protein